MDITHTLPINASVETIYKAVATQQGITGWWSKDCTVGETEGGSSSLTFIKEGNAVNMGFRTVSLSPNKKVVWECTENVNPAWIGTQIITEISVTDSGSQVEFAHAGFDEKWAGEPPFEMTKGGWEHFMSSLVKFCETGEGMPW